jgi:hypothetical protein
MSKEGTVCQLDPERMPKFYIAQPFERPGDELPRNTGSDGGLQPPPFKQHPARAFRLLFHRMRTQLAFLDSVCAFAFQ